MAVGWWSKPCSTRACGSTCNRSKLSWYMKHVIFKSTFALFCHIRSSKPKCPHDLAHKQVKCCGNLYWYFHMRNCYTWCTHVGIFLLLDGCPLLLHVMYPKWSYILLLLEGYPWVKMRTYSFCCTTVTKGQIAQITNPFVTRQESRARMGIYLP